MPGSGQVFRPGSSPTGRCDVSNMPALKTTPQRFAIPRLAGESGEHIER